MFRAACLTAIRAVCLTSLLLLATAVSARLSAQDSVPFGERPEYRWSGETGYSSTVDDVPLERVRAALPERMPAHPYLYFDATGMEEIRRRIERDPESAAIRDNLLAVAFKLLHQPVQMQVPIQARDPRAGWTPRDRGEGYKRTEYEDHYRETSENAFTLAFVYQLTGDPRYAAKAYEFADAFCEFPTWTRRAHEFPIIYDRIWPWNVSDDQVNFSFDHHNGDVLRLMGAVYDWLHPALDRRQRDRLRGAMLEKGINRVRGHYEQHWWATAYRTNWAGVNHSGLGVAALALLGEHPEFADVVAESYNGIRKMLSELGADGAWAEGGGYWSYGVTTSATFGDALKRVTGGELDLFQQTARLKANPITFPAHITLPNGFSLDFQDSKGRRIGSTHLYNKLAAEYDDPQAAWFRETYFGAGQGIWDLIWPRAEVAPAPPAHPSKEFRTWGWWVMRSDFTDPDRVLLAGMAGRNNEPHHGHLSVGHFVLNWRGEYYIRDLGSPTYDQLFFNEVRWSHYPHAMSEGHNVVFVNSERQLPGKRKDQPWDHSLAGQILDFRSDDRRDYVLKDNSDAYPGQELLGWRRHVVHLKDAQATVVLDEVRARDGAEIEARFHSGVRLEAGTDHVRLRGEGGVLAHIPLSDGPVELRQGRHAIQLVHGGYGLQHEPYYGWVTRARGSGATPLVSLLLPESAEADAAEMTRSARLERHSDGSLDIAFEFAGSRHSLRFEQDKEGWIWRE